MEASVFQKLTETYKGMDFEAVVDYSIRMANLYRSKYPINLRKEKGQIFTPKEVAAFMASLLSLRSGEMGLLDPGAGTGILTAALCERILNSKIKAFGLTVDLQK